LSDRLIEIDKKVHNYADLDADEKYNKLLKEFQSLGDELSKAKKEYDFFKIEKDYLKTAQKIELQNLVQLESGNTIEKVTASNETNNFVLRLNSQEIAFPIQVRYPLKDDKIVVKNFQGHQKVNRIFIDKKIPKSERMTWPILVDNSDQILWIPGLKKSQFDREINEEYDIIYKYNLSKERIYAKKK